MSDPLDQLTAELDRSLVEVDRNYAAHYPGKVLGRQPVHTVYVPADHFNEGTVASWGSAAIDSLDRFGSSASELAAATGLSVEQVRALLPRVRAKLTAEPIEDLRVDFEDGYGPGRDEDADAIRVARLLACGGGSARRPASHGIRIKSFDAATRRRGLRTLWLFIETFSRADPSDARLVLTLPKVVAVAQVEAMVHACAVLERQFSLPEAMLRFEIQIEAPQAILAADGTAEVAKMIHAAEGRCSGLHYGTYDYSAACGIAGAYQSMEHPVADHAKAVMQVAAAQTGVTVCDGSTNVIPVGDSSSVHAAWGSHFRLVRRSLERGFYQGWDLHPAQLPTRYLATYAFFRDSLDATTARLRAYGEQNGCGFLDEPATARALARFVVRGVECGAVEVSEAEQRSGQDLTAIRRLAA